MVHWSVFLINFYIELSLRNRCERKILKNVLQASKFKRSKHKLYTIYLLYRLEIYKEKFKDDKTHESQLSSDK